jgi:hypothetical protein
LTLLEDLAADVQDADAKLMSLSDRITLLDELTSDKKRVCMLQQHQALARFRLISQTLLEVEQQEQGGS